MRKNFSWFLLGLALLLCVGAGSTNLRSLIGLSDVTDATPTLGNVLRGNGSAWASAQLDTSEVLEDANLYYTAERVEDQVGGSLMVAGTGISLNYNDAGNSLTVSNSGVTSVALGMPGQFAISGSPVTTTGTLTASWNTQPANTVLSGPTSGGAAAPSFRALVAADLPTNLQAGTTLDNSGTDNAGLGGTLYTHLSVVGNVGTGEDNLHSYTLPANTLSADGQGLRIKASGNFNSTTNAKTLKFYVGELSFVLLDAVAVDGELWTADITIFRHSYLSVASNIHFTYADLTPTAPDTPNAVILTTVGSSHASLDFGTSEVVKFTAEATDNNDVQQYTMLIEWFPDK